MTYKEVFHPKIKSDLKKLSKSVVEEIKNRHLDIISLNPLENKKLKGNLSNLYSYHFRNSRVEYRIVYDIRESEIIFYYMMAKRENFYKNIQSRI